MGTLIKCPLILLLMLLDLFLVIDPITGLAVGSAIIGGLGSIFGSSSSNRQNVALTRETNAMNYKIHQEDVQAQKEMQKVAMGYNTGERVAAQNYNSEVAQLQRMRAAGINPSLQGLSSAQSSPASVSGGSVPSAPQMIASHVEPVNYGQPLQDLMNSAAVASGISKNQADIARDVRQLGLQSEDVNIRKQAQQVSADMAKSSMAVNDEILKQVQQDTRLKSEEVLSKQLYNKLYADLAERGMKVNEQQADAALQSVSATLASIANSYKLGMMQLQQGYYFHENMSSYEKANVSNEMKRINLDFANNLAQFRNQVWSLKIDERYKRDIIKQGKRELDFDLSKWRTDFLGRIGLNGMSSSALGLGMRLLR